MIPGVPTSLPRQCRQSTLPLQADETGATAIEYGLIAALVALALLGGLKALGADIAGLPLEALIDAISAVRA